MKGRWFNMMDAQISRINQEVSNKQPGLLKRIWWAVTSPGKLMECLAQKPRILFGLILAAVSMDILYILRMPLFTEFIRGTLYKTSEYMESLVGQSMTAQMIEDGLPKTIIQTLITTPISIVISLLFMTLVYFAILKIMGGKGTFKAYLSVMGYSYIISALYILLLIPISFVTGSLHEELPLTSLATLLNDDMAGTFLYGVSKGLDVFTIWHAAVTAVGLVAVSKLKKPYVYSVAAGIFIIGLLIAGAGELMAKVFM